MEEPGQPGLNPTGERSDLLGEVDGDRLAFQGRTGNDGDQPGLTAAAGIVGELPDRGAVDAGNRGRNDQIRLGDGQVRHGRDLHVHHGRVLGRVGHLEHELSVDQHVDVALAAESLEPPGGQIPGVLEKRPQPVVRHGGRKQPAGRPRPHRS